jgi:hypothetical protein
MAELQDKDLEQEVKLLKKLIEYKQYIFCIGF